jgi:hypothetical protein
MQAPRITWTYSEKLSFTKNYLKVKDTNLKPFEKFSYAQKDLGKDRRRHVGDISKVTWLPDFIGIYEGGYKDSVEQEEPQVDNTKQLGIKEEQLSIREKQISIKEKQIKSKEAVLRQKEEDIKDELEYIEIEKAELKEREKAIADESEIYRSVIEKTIYKILGKTEVIIEEPLRNILLVGAPLDVFQEVAPKFSGIYNIINWKTSARNDFVGLKAEIDKAFKVYAPSGISSTMNNYLRKISGPKYTRFAGGAPTLCALLEKDSKV